MLNYSAFDTLGNYADGITNVAYYGRLSIRNNIPFVVLFILYIVILVKVVDWNDIAHNLKTH